MTGSLAEPGVGSGAGSAPEGDTDSGLGAQTGGGAGLGSVSAGAAAGSGADSGAGSDAGGLGEVSDRTVSSSDHAPDPLDPRDDQGLLRAHVDGDELAFAILVARHQDRLWGVALRTMKQPEEAADALQEALVAAFRRAGQFRGDSAVLTWLHRIVVNACLDGLRRSRVRASDPLPEDPDRILEFVAEDDPVADVEALEVRHDVAAALALLNADQRAALILVDMEGYSIDEAAVILGCAPGTVKSRASRGRAKLVPLLSHLQVS